MIDVYYSLNFILISLLIFVFKRLKKQVIEKSTIKQPFKETACFISFKIINSRKFIILCKQNDVDINLKITF